MFSKLARSNHHTKKININNIKIVLFYSLFSFISAFVNISAQIVTRAIYSGPFDIEIAIFFGLITGLLVKFFLDKFYIFKSNNFLNKSKLIFLFYVITSIFTTLIFIGFQYLFIFIFGDLWIVYIGAILGLIVGYFTKYHLDKSFVFKR